MNYRIMLESAAKANGFDFFKFVECVNDYDSPHNRLPAIKLKNSYETWNPLEDDGDAFRLAIKLGIEHSWNSIGYATAHWHMGANMIAEYGNDPFDAVRRAIVRAAVDIGAAHE
jgi:hypothetical protein